MVKDREKSNFKLDYLKICITKECNYHCAFCSQSDFNNNQTLPFAAVLKHVLSLFHPRLFILTGGEPLLEQGIVIDYIHYCKQNNIELGIFTNMALLSEALIKEMVELEPFWLRTTINGASEALHEMTYPRGSFKKLINSIGLAVQNGIKVKARVTISKINYKAIPEIIEAIAGLGITEIDFRPYAPLSFQRHDDYLLTIQQHLLALKWILALKEEYPRIKITLLPNWFDFIILQHHGFHDCALCNCGKTYLYIDSNGDILTCAGYRNELGNIFTDNIMSVYKDSSFLKQVRAERYADYCTACPAYCQCRKSNCHIINYEVYHKLDSVNPLCPVFKLSPNDPQSGYDRVREMYHSL